MFKWNFSTDYVTKLLCTQTSVYEMDVVYGVDKVSVLCGMYMGFKILNMGGRSGGNAQRWRQRFPQKHNSYAQALHVIELCGQVK